ncbi:TMEM165/GDT1 family protein [Pontibacter sp. JAM-7]|uniref:TMEM165/GDT1 family protein n=1 Tax=Pontibacter sp. JAM-7 TaxID=3366581 RepID=UPI003AF65C02
MDAFFTSTMTVALAEIGDKTQLLSLLLAARFRNKTAIIAGILLATLLNHAVSAWLGNWLGQFLQSDLGRWVIGGSFILLAAWLLIPDKEDETDSRFDSYGPFVVATILFFLAEIGDKTQVATVLLGAQFESIFWVTMGTTLGMLIANVPVVYAGDYLMQRIPMNAVRVAAAVVFAGVGIWHSPVFG